MTSVRTTVCPPEHAHDATSTCRIRHACGCQPCRSASRQRERQRRRAIAYGRYVSPFVDAEPIRRHILDQQAAGLAPRRLAAAAAIDPAAIRRIASGRRSRVRRTTAGAILAVRACDYDVADGSRVDAVGVRRRLQALVAAGWTTEQLAAALPADQRRVRRLLHAEAVTAATARQVRAVLDDRWHRPPPCRTEADLTRSERAKRYAHEQGWVPALAWDDIDTDDHPAEGSTLAPGVRNRGA